MVTSGASPALSHPLSQQTFEGRTATTPFRAGSWGCSTVGLWMLTRSRYKLSSLRPQALLERIFDLNCALAGFGGCAFHTPMVGHGQHNGEIGLSPRRPEHASVKSSYTLLP